MLSNDSLHGRVVLSGDGLSVGEVTKVLLDPAHLQIGALEVRLHKQIAERLGLAHGILRGPTMQIPREKLQSIGDAVILAVPVDALRDTKSASGAATKTRA